MTIFPPMRLDRDGDNAQCINDQGTRKKMFHSGKEARRAGKSKGLRSYRCEICKLWHLTHKPKKFAPLKEISPEDLTDAV
jgi:hypothetical protein